ncbi:hypothetical protein GGF32_006795, partial [Allomyces javanicus]
MSSVTALLGALVDDDSISADTYIREVINTVSAIEMYSKTSFWNPADMPVLQTMYSAHTDADGIIQRLFDVQDVDARDAVLKPLLTAPPAQDIKDPLGDMASAAMDLTWTMTRVSKAAETCVDHLAGLDVTGRWPGLKQVLEKILGVLVTLGVVLSTVWKLSKATDEPVPADLADKAHRGLRQPDPPRETVQSVLDTLRDLAQVVRGIADVLPQRVLGAAKNLPPEKYPGLTDYLVKETNRAVAQMNQASLALAGAGPQRGGGSMDLVKSWRESSAYRRIRLIRDDRPSHDVLDAFYESPPYRPWAGYRNWARDLVAVPLKRALAPRDNGRSTRYLLTLQFDDLGSSVDNELYLKMTGRYYRNVLIVECQRDSNGYLPTEVAHYQHVVNQILHPATDELERHVRNVFGGNKRSLQTLPSLSRVPLISGELILDPPLDKHQHAELRTYLERPPGNMWRANSPRSIAVHSEVSLLAKITVDLADISQYFSYWGTTVCGTVQYLCPDPIPIQGTLWVDRNYNVVNTTSVVRPLSSSSRASQTPGPCSPLSGRDRVGSFNNDHYNEQWTARHPTLYVEHIDELYPRQMPPLYFHHGKSESEYFDPRVVRLMQKPQPEQRTPEWYETRRGSITASNMGAVLLRDYETSRYFMDLFGIAEADFVDTRKSFSKYSNVRDYIKKMVEAEPTFTGNEYTKWGQKYEPVVQTVYSQMYQIDLVEFGLLSHDTCPFLAASPDGIDAQGVMVEIKCPSVRPIGPIVPCEYYQQIQAQLECCDLDLCRFVDCRFLEYLHVEDWDVDAGLSETGQYHRYGILLEDNQGKYTYADPTIVTPDQFKEWAATRSLEILEETDAFPRPVYYVLDEFKVIEVPREPGWLERNMNRIQD